MWPILSALLLCGIFLVHIIWRKKFLRAVAHEERNLAQVQELQRENASKAEAQQRALFDSMIEGLLMLDNQGRIQLANKALENLFGVTSSIYGKTIIEALRNHQLAELANRLQNEPQILEYEIQLSEIQPRWFQVNAAALLDGNGNHNGMIFVFHDLTRLKQLENTRQEFVANVSHELRTPLSMIKGYVETLRDGAKDDPIVAEKFLATIEKHTDRLTFLIEDLLTISTLESNKVVLSRRKIELWAVVDTVIQDLKTRADEKGVRLENHVPRSLTVHADLEKLEQVLWNLIDNAIKYGKDAGSVTIGARDEQPNIHVWVQDDGLGIPLEAIGRVFERFYRVDKARSREKGGTGLGLAIVKHLVHSHGGQVWVESKQGLGSIFYFSVPDQVDGIGASSL